MLCAVVKAELKRLHQKEDPDTEAGRIRFLERARTVMPA